MTVEEDILEYLEQEGERRSVREIADAIGASYAYTRKIAIKLKKEGKLDGGKYTPIPACVIGGRLIVLTGNKDKLLEIVQRYSPHDFDSVKNYSVKRLQKFIQGNICEDIAIVGNAWDFWIK